MDGQTRNNIALVSKKLYAKEKMVRDYYSLYDRIVPNKKILEIDVNYKHSSTGQIVYDIYSASEKYNKEVAVCYGRGKLYREKNVFKFGIDIETYMHAVLSRVTGYNGCFSFFSTKRLIKYIEDFQPDIIHIHELHAYFVNIKPLINYIKQSKIPLVWTFHCEYMYTGKCGYAYECTQFQTSCCNCPAIKQYPKSLFFDRTKQMYAMKYNLLSNMDFTITTPSKWLEDRVKLSILKEKPINTIWNGVDTTTFFPRVEEALDLKKKLMIKNEKTVLFVAPDVSDYRKGAHWVVKLAWELIKENIIFIMVGGGTYKGDYPSNVKYVGKVLDKRLLAAYYSMSDAYVICSERETYSMTCAEALCCGTPVVGFKSGAPETVFQGEYVQFVPYGDLTMLRNALTNTLERD